MAARFRCCDLNVHRQYLKKCLENSRKLHCCARILYCAQGKPERKPRKYTDTVTLPRTDFPLRLDAQKRIDRDIYLYKKCEFSSLYAWQREHVNGPDFVLHDGPPYANGKVHMGHAINKILKDIITRHKLLQGHRIHYVPGWDCHGLPIELKALDGKTDLPVIKIRNKAEKFAREAIASQRESFCYWGVMADWDKCYFTFDKEYLKNQLQQFCTLHEKGFVYRDTKPVFWSPSSRTALAEAELEYNPTHCSTAITLRLLLQKAPEVIRSHTSLPVFALVWTTTPWSLPANQAVAYNPDLSYSLVTIQGRAEETYLVASELVEELQNKFGQQLEIVTSFPGSCLKDATYVHPLRSERVQPFLPATHVTTAKGTGLVHTAPAHGPEDFLVALRHSIPVECLVDEDGCYMEDTGSTLQGLSVLSTGNQKVLELLSANILHSEQLVHSYPYDWRTKQPVILRASRQWFIDTNSIKHKAIEVLNEVKIFPEHSGSSKSGGGLVAQIERRPYWCISRQRVWGVPIPVLYNKTTGAPLITRSFINHLCNLLDDHGTDFWWTLPLQTLVPQQVLADHGLTLDQVEKGQDILDIWLDSGLSWSAVLEGNKMADLYLEGLDQFTGWFQSSLMTSVALRNQAPFRAVFVHGFAVDAEGRKMSKSLGNVVNPQDITHGGKDKKCAPAYGVDTLRWWVACHATQHSSIPVSRNVLNASAEAVHKIRIVLRFLLGAINDLPSATTSDCHENLFLLDRYLLHLLLDVEQQVTKLFESYQFNTACIALVNFVTNDVSALYCHLTKDRLYCEPVDSPERRACQFVLSHILECVTRAVAPIMPHLAEEVYLHHPCKQGQQLFRSGVVRAQSSWHQPEVETIINTALDVKRMINKMSPVTNTQQLSATVFTSGQTLGLLRKLQEEPQSQCSQLTEILQVCSATMVESESPLKFHVELADTTGYLCGRCRRFTAHSAEEPCERCQQVLGRLAAAS